MIETIAVGTDGTQTANVAVDAAFELARRFDADVVLLSAFSGRDRVAGGGAPLEEQWLTNPADAVHAMLHATAERAASEGIRVRTDSADGDPAAVLVRLAEKHGADVLVIGNQGMHRRILGSVPNSVTHSATCSVFVVKTS